MYLLSHDNQAFILSVIGVFIVSNPVIIKNKSTLDYKLLNLEKTIFNANFGIIINCKPVFLMFFDNILQSKFPKLYPFFYFVILIINFVYKIINALVGYYSFFLTENYFLDLINQYIWQIINYLSLF